MQARRFVLESRANIVLICKVKRRALGGSRLAILVVTLLVCVTNFSFAAHSNAPTQNDADETRPNVLLIVADDLAFNDLSLYGSEIDTPNIDTLANGGVTFSNFHASPTCSPTRAMLLTGTDSHIVGMGAMAERMETHQKGRKGYEGYLNSRAVTLPELLQGAGYNTFMAGKWHLGLSADTSPSARGFDQSFSLANGGAGAFHNQLGMLPKEEVVYWENGKRVEELPRDFYSTEFYTQKMIDYIEGGRESGKPFFGYLAYTAPHWPLQAPQESISKYVGVYADGYEVLNQRRLNLQIARGFYAADTEHFPRLLGTKSWEDLSQEQQQFEAKKMAIYAAMIDDVDVYIGQLIDHLKSIGAYDNTVIIFMSDNGPEGAMPINIPGMKAYLRACCDNSYDNIGNATSYVWLGPNWAQAGNTPLRGLKTYTSQGGVRVPALVHFPRQYDAGRRVDDVITVKDIMPTILELAQTQHPGAGTYQGREIVAMQGRPLQPVLTGDKKSIREAGDYMGWELFDRRAIRQGEWKLVYLSERNNRRNKIPVAKMKTWQLYNLAEDPSELSDVSAEHPEKFEQLLSLWDDYVYENGVLLAD